MACHLACAKCHNKLFKISNMSIQNARRDCVKPNAIGQKIKKSWSEELETALKYNDQLEKENANLQAELHELAIKNENLLQALDQSKEQFETDLAKVRNELKIHEKQLIDNAKKSSEQQRKFSDEIRKLKQENAEVMREKNDIENSLTEKLKSLESELKINKLDNYNLRACSKQNEEKCLKYKEKLKQAVKIVNDLNCIVAQYGAKPEIVNKTTQTEVDNLGEKSHLLGGSQCGDTRYKREINSENLLLSDIFFKPKSFLDSEIDLFKVRSKSNSSVNVKC